MTSFSKYAAAGALLASVLAMGGCKQPVHSTAASSAPASVASTSGVTPVPATGTPAGGTAAVDGAKSAAFKAARKEVRQACRDDLQACRTAGTRPMRCLRAKMDQLKPDCKAALQAMMQDRRAGKGAGKGL